MKNVKSETSNPTTKQRQMLRESLKGYLTIMGGSKEAKKLNDDYYMEVVVLPTAPTEIKQHYWAYRSMMFEWNARKIIRQDKIMAEECCLI